VPELVWGQLNPGLVTVAVQQPEHPVGLEGSVSLIQEDIGLIAGRADGQACTMA
jgi:hypothetical protein